MFKNQNKHELLWTLTTTWIHVLFCPGRLSWPVRRRSRAPAGWAPQVSGTTFYRRRVGAKVLSGDNNKKLGVERASRERTIGRTERPRSSTEERTDTSRRDVAPGPAAAFRHGGARADSLAQRYVYTRGGDTTRHARGSTAWGERWGSGGGDDGSDSAATVLRASRCSVDWCRTEGPGKGTFFTRIGRRTRAASVGGRRGGRHAKKVTTTLARRW